MEAYNNQLLNMNAVQVANQEAQDDYYRPSWKRMLNQDQLLNMNAVQVANPEAQDDFGVMAALAAGKAAFAAGKMIHGAI